MEVLKTLLHPIYGMYDVDFHDLVEQHDHVAGKSITSSLDFVLSDTVYYVRLN